METLTAMYDLIRRTREVLFAYCDTLPPEVYTAERPGISMGSIRNIHLHVTDCYRGWLGAFGLADPAISFDPTPPATVPDVPAMRRQFAEVDALVTRFLDRYAADITAPVAGRAGPEGRPLTVTPLWLFTHTTTHEFHHKGQIVLFGREAGYPAWDTDLIP